MAASVTTIAADKLCIIGGGIVGLVLARLVQQNRPQRQVTVIDAGAPAEEEGKSVVVTANAASVLEMLAALPENSRPIRQVRVSFAGVAGATHIGGDDILGYGVDYKAVRQALQQGVVVRQTRAQRWEDNGDSVDLDTADGETLQATGLAIACALPAYPSAFRTRAYRYRQTVLSLTAATDEYGDEAEECLTERGMIALVPRPDKAVGVILSASPDIAGGVNAMSDKSLSAYLTRVFNRRLEVYGKRFAYPPKVVRRSPLAHGRIALIGQGATSLHPIGAQGLSLGVTDAQCLAEQLASNGISPAAFAGYARRRIFAHRTTALATTAAATTAHCRGYPFRLAGGIYLYCNNFFHHRRRLPAIAAVSYRKHEAISLNMSLF